MSRDSADMMAALRRILPGGEAITGIAPMTTGFSNDTYLVEGADLILRLPPQAGAMLDGHDVLGQARIYQELGQVAGAPPVPAIVLASADASILGAPFFVMAKVAGEAIHDTLLQDWFTGASNETRSHYARQWVSAFAGLARLDPLTCLGPVQSPEDDARRWQAFGSKANCPELVELFDRLLAVPAPLSGPPAVIHGDAKLSNLMWHQGQISAMLDWEMALNGEPLADLGYILFGFESPYHRAATPARQPGMPSRDEVIALWSQVSGRPSEGVIWHEIAQMGKLCAIIAEGANMASTGRSEDPKLAIFMQSRDYYLGVMRAMLDSSAF
jgi:aminoglycoside phosphotransferase (APT) family kinase protein